MSTSTIDCALDFDGQVYIERRNTTTRAAEAATGLTGVTLRLSATRGGDAIGPLSGTAVEASGALGTYVYTFDQPDLAAHLLPTYAASVIYLVVEKTGDIDTKSFPYTVIDGD
jgi:hypothetical protein